MTGPQSESFDSGAPIWRDPHRNVADRVKDLMPRLSLQEKVAQLYSVWVGATVTGGDLAPLQHELADEVGWPDVIQHGLGQLTRPFGTAPIDAATGARALAKAQAEIVAAGRFGIPAIAHEECLTGFMTLGATVYPTSLAWGASFDPELVETMANQIGSALRRVGVHQGLAPVLDVTRDARWGRTEETIGEDPYLVATVGSAYVRGLQSAGVIATLKHFAGYSGSRAGRNFGPVAVGPREFADVFLPPFEMAVREAGAGSVMHSYAEIDGVPAAADQHLLTGVLRDTWGFAGTVVSDYFGVSFLQLLHGIAASPGQAAALSLQAGVDVELPGVRCFGQPLLDALRSGDVAEAVIDRAVERVLRQKFELGLLDPQWTPDPFDDGFIDLDPPASRDVARRLAEESVVLLANDGALPLRPGVRVGLVGAQGDDPMAMLGCYTFPSHVATRHEGTGMGVAIPTLRQALTDEFGEVEFAVGCTVDTDDRSGLAAAADLAARVDVCVVALGDRAGLFGDGTSGEGSDAPDLHLPGLQHDLVEAVLATGTPVVLVLLAGRPYALGAYVGRVAAIVEAFFPGEEGGSAVTGVLSGRVNPSGRLPVSVPHHPGAQPTTYLAPQLGHAGKVSSIDPTPAFPFGHGLSYTEFSWSSPVVAGEAVLRTDGSLNVSMTVTNVGSRSGAEIVQLYLHDPVAQVTRPVVRLIGYARVPLEPGQSTRVTFDVSADVTAFVGLAGRRIVEPGVVELRLGASSTDIRHTVALQLVGPEREVGHDRQLTVPVTLAPPVEVPAPAAPADLAPQPH